MDDESPVAEIWDTAESDGGLAYFDQRGVLRYENALHWLTHSSVWTFDEGTYQLSEPRLKADDVATGIEVEYAPRYVGAPVNVYEQEKYRIIEPNGTLEFVARFDYAAHEIFDPDPTVGIEDYYVSSLGGVNMTDYVTVELTEKYGQQCTVTITNSSSTLSARVDAFRIRGLPLIGAPTEQASATADPAPYTFERIRRQRGNIYMQTYEQCAMLAELLALRCRRVRPSWKLNGVPGVPHLELMDIVTFKDDRALGTDESIDGLVMEISWDSSADGGFIQSILVMDVTDLSAYDSYFLIGIDALGASERIYY
jgi:hypothetical protein